MNADVNSKSQPLILFCAITLTLLMRQMFPNDLSKSATSVLPGVALLLFNQSYTSLSHTYVTIDKCVPEQCI